VIASVLLALGSAMSFAVSTVVQHRAASSCPEEAGTGRVFKLVRRLVQHPAWLCGQGAAVVGLVLHALALRDGAVVMVQPILSSGLVLSLVLGALVDRRHPGRPLPDRGQWASALLVAVGLGLFLLTAHPEGGRSAGRPLAIALCLVGAIGVALLAAAWAWRPTAPHRALVLGLASGCGFGVTGLLLKALMAINVGQWLVSWPFYALLISGAIGITMAQWAYQAGSLIESLPTMAVLEPVIAIGLAGPLFGETLAPGLLAHAGQLLGVVVLCTGVVTLARRTARREQPELVVLSGGVVGGSTFPTPVREIGTGSTRLSRVRSAS